MAESEKKTTAKAAEKTKGFVAEFKKFIMRGNVIDLAVGVIIGAAFGNIVTALTENVINPLIGCIGNPEVEGFVIPLIKGQEINLGPFITAVINFLIMALVLFIIVKAMNKAMTVGKKKEEEAPKTTKICPYCKSEINKDATKCPHCTSQLDA